MMDGIETPMLDLGGCLALPTGYVIAGEVKYPHPWVKIVVLGGQLLRAILCRVRHGAVGVRRSMPNRACRYNRRRASISGSARPRSRRPADLPADDGAAWSRLIDIHDRGHGHLPKQSGPGITPEARPIRRAVYIRPCCHLNLYCHDGRRCQTSPHRSSCGAARPSVRWPAGRETLRLSD
jgi:hypothetical protein